MRRTKENIVKLNNRSETFSGNRFNSQDPMNPPDRPPITIVTKIGQSTPANFPEKNAVITVAP
nr:hypothetical protein [Bacillus coahuilensis]